MAEGVTKKDIEKRWLDSIKHDFNGLDATKKDVESSNYLAQVWAIKDGSGALYGAELYGIRYTYGHNNTVSGTLMQFVKTWDEIDGKIVPDSVDTIVEGIVVKHGSALRIDSHSFGGPLEKGQKKRVVNFEFTVGWGCYKKDPDGVWENKADVLEVHNAPITDIIWSKGNGQKKYSSTFTFHNDGTWELDAPGLKKSGKW
jgi:hypothetical protein